MVKENFLSTDTGQRTILGVCITVFLLISLLLFGYVDNKFHSILRFWYYSKIHFILFILLLGISYKLTDYYVYVTEKISYIFDWLIETFRLSLHDTNKSARYWPNLLVFFEPTTVWNIGNRIYLNFSSYRIQKNKRNYNRKRNFANFFVFIDRTVITFKRIHGFI